MVYMFLLSTLCRYFSLEYQPTLISIRYQPTTDDTNLCYFFVVWNVSKAMSSDIAETENNSQHQSYLHLLYWSVNHTYRLVQCRSAGAEWTDFYQRFLMKSDIIRYLFLGIGPILDWLRALLHCVAVQHEDQLTREKYGRLI